MHKIKIERLAPKQKEPAEQSAKRLLVTYENCPHCMSSRIQRYNIARKQQYHLGLFRTDYVTMRGNCNDCGTEWWESKTIKHTTQFVPLKNWFLYYGGLVVFIAAFVICLVLYLNLKATVSDNPNHSSYITYIIIGMICCIPLIIYLMFEIHKKNKWRNDRDR